jgi:hypothetical protein
MPTPLFQINDWNVINDQFHVDISPNKYVAESIIFDVYDFHHYIERHGYFDGLPSEFSIYDIQCYTNIDFEQIMYDFICVNFIDFDAALNRLETNLNTIIC